MLAEANIRHPARILICGKSGSGKTFLGIHIAVNILRREIDRFIIICPSWATQKAFRCLDPYIKPDRDVIEDLTKDTFVDVYNQILAQNSYSEKEGKKKIRTCLIIDDCGSDKAIHGGRISTFGRIAIQFRPLGVSSILMAQNPKLVSPNYRENANHFIFFPTRRIEEKEWMYKEFGSGLFTKYSFFQLLEKAWKEDDDDGETHFLYIYDPARAKIKFYSDFSTELTISKRLRTWKPSDFE
jgi:hypothetical protein